MFTLEVLRRGFCLTPTVNEHALDCKKALWRLLADTQSNFHAPVKTCAIIVACVETMRLILDMSLPLMYAATVSLERPLR